MTVAGVIFVIDSQECGSTCGSVTSRGHQTAAVAAYLMSTYVFRCSSHRKQTCCRFSSYFTPIKTSQMKHSPQVKAKREFVNRKEADVISAGSDRGKLFPEVDTARIISTPKPCCFSTKWPPQVSGTSEGVSLVRLSSRWTLSDGKMSEDTGNKTRSVKL